jgi:hypothetical protein
MGFRKGSLSFQFSDQQMLRTVADAKYITHSQLFQLACLKAFEFKRRTFNWRTRRLSEAGLLRKHRVSHVGSEPLYSITRSGIQALEQMGVRFLGGGHVERETDPDEEVTAHVLEITRIRIALEESHALMSWIPESFIRVLNLSPLYPYAKVYDAIVKVNRGDDVWIEFAIEYERTLKDQDRYARILEAIESETRLDTILYLGASYEITSTVRSYFQCTRRKILFAPLDDFLRDRLDTEIVFANTYRRTPLRVALGCEK